VRDDSADPQALSGFQDPGGRAEMWLPGRCPQGLRVCIPEHQAHRRRNRRNVSTLHRPDHRKCALGAGTGGVKGFIRSIFEEKWVNGDGQTSARDQSNRAVEKDDLRGDVLEREISQF